MRLLGGLRAGAWLLLALPGALATVFFFYPGFINSDSQWQLDQARSGLFNDWHPPLMAWLWTPLDQLIPGTGGLFLFHTALFWIGVVAVAIESMPTRARATVVSLVVGLFPPTFLVLASVGKDAGITAALVAASGLLLRAHARRSRACWLGAMPCLIYALGVRHNALAAVLPLVAWAGWMAPGVFRARVADSRMRQRILRIAGVLALSAALPAVVSFLERRVIKPTRSHVSQAVMIHDLVGISLRSNENLLPPVYARDGNPLTLDELKGVYSPIEVTGLLWALPGARVPGFVWTDAEHRQLRLAWLDAIGCHLASYLGHRASHFIYVLGLRPNAHWPYWLPPVTESQRQSSIRAAIQGRIFDAMGRHRQSALFRGWFYCAVILAALAVAFILRRATAALLIVAASALAYEAAYFIVGTASQFRFSWWPMAASLLCLLLVARGRRPETAVTGTASDR